MSYFKQPKKPKKQPNTIDGFIKKSPDGLTRRSVQARFRSTYRPKVSDMTSKDDVFLRRQPQNNEFVQKKAEQEVLSQKSDTIFEEALKPEPEEPKNKKRLFRRRGQEKHKKHTKFGFRRAAKAFSILLVAMVIGVASLFAYGYIKARNIFKGDGEGAAALQENVDPARLNGEGDGRVNILLMGKGGPGHAGADLTDTLLLASIDPLQNEAALVSVPRDMYVQDANGHSTKINAVYSNAKQARLANGNENDSDRQAAENAGIRAVQTEMTDILGVPIHYYVMVDFVAFEEAINTVGGVDVNVQEPLIDYTIAHEFGGDPVIAEEGLQTFDGKRALFYARSRKNVGGRGDFDRTERQREIIVALQKKVLSVGTFSNPFKVVDLLSTFGDRVRTDLNGVEEIKRLHEIGQNIGPDKITSVGLADPPNVLVTTGMVGSQSVVMPTAGLYQYDEIRSYIRNTIRDPYLKRENARVVVLNGTNTAGLATATSEELKSYGYNVIGVDNAPTSDYVRNQLIDLTGGEMRYTKSYIERRLGLSATENPPEGLPTPEEADFVIILGTDEVIKTTN